ncbi:uncharacterized protein LOC129595805 [Paramacrobiotus metropolitanus]|uniref:uncharacterized protein LOC129595805 n=1 Tax=Paramacrobiotus metropolitanus TaxID=2943436 RepID=UPI002445F79B|nr:uncharacterized protein LOC129595805 [Paramacrobiotus metropolitanus]
MQDFVFKCCRLPCDTLHIGPNALALMACDFHTDPFYRRIYRRKAEEFTIQVEIDIHATRLKPDGGFGCALWEAMEAALPVPSDGDVHDLFQRFRVGGDLRNNNKLKALLCTALCALQSADPRPSSHYHGKKWCVEGLEEVQLENLSRICRQLLIELRELMVERQW